MLRGSLGRHVGRCARAVGCVALAALAQTAQGQELQPSIALESPKLVYPGRVPSGGGLLFAPSAFGRGYVIRVSSVDAPDTELPGSFELLDEYAVWRADPPLRPGEYWVRVSAGEQAPNASVYRIEVIEAEPEAPRLVLEPSASLSSNTVRSACCDQWHGGQFQPAISCFGTTIQDFVVLDLGLSTPSPSALVGQHLYQVRSTEPIMFAARFLPWHALETQAFETQAARYCFSVEAMNIVTRELTGREEVTCSEHGALPALTTHDVEPSEEALDAVRCHSPPPEYQPEWCELNAVLCESETHPEATGCALLEYVCEGAPFPGTTNKYYFPVAAPDAAVEDKGEPSTRAQAEGSGCSVAQLERAARPRGGLALWVLALLALRWRIAFAPKLAMLDRGKR
jgi:hypothetical protein